MRGSLGWMAAALLLGSGAPWAAAALPPARAPSPLPAAAVPVAAAGTLHAAEDVAVLEALAPLKLSHDQLAQLLPAEEGARAKLAEQDRSGAARLDAWRSVLQQAREGLLSGKRTGAEATARFAQEQWSVAQARAGVRADLVRSLTATFESLLTPEQLNKVTQHGEALAVQERFAAWSAHSGRSPTDGIARRLDRLRQMDPVQFNQYTSRRAGRMGGQSAPRFQQFSAFMDNVRNMSQTQYLLQRDELAVQSLAQRGRRFGRMLTGSAADSIQAFVGRYLLSPRAPQVMADLLRAAPSR